MKKAIEIVDTWLKNRHEDVIKELEKKPKLQLNYLQKVLNTKEAEIESIADYC